MKKTAGRKRKAVGIIVRARKKTRGLKRRKANNTSQTSRALNSSNAFQFRSKKLTPRKLRQMLWRDTIMMTHYRSIFTAVPSVGLSTPANTFECNFIRMQALTDIASNEFWRTAGGFQDPSFGITPDWAIPPSATTPEPITIVIRGGVLSLRIANPSLTDTMNIRCQLIWTKEQRRNTDDSAASNTLVPYENAVGLGPRPLTWTIQAAPDYAQYYYPPVMDKQIDLKPGDDVNFYHRLKVSKIDVASFQRGASWFPIWVVYASQTVDTTAGAQPVTIHINHNLSFCVLDTSDV